MNTSTPLRIQQYETVLYNTNLNPLGIPDSVTKSIQQNIGTITKYPDIYYQKLKKAVAEYAGVELDDVVLGNGSADILKLFGALVMPKKTVVLSPGSSEYDRVMSAYGSEIVF